MTEPERETLPIGELMATALAEIGRGCVGDVENDPVDENGIGPKLALVLLGIEWKLTALLNEPPETEC